MAAAMILAEDYDLLFVHVPQTGGTAIRQYLQDHLGGVPVGRQHQVWEQVCRDLPHAERLRIMTCIRDPLDQTVSSYHKLRSDHRGGISTGRSGERRQAQSAFVTAPDVDFERWFLRYRTRVYAPRWVSSVRRSRWILRFESLDADLRAALVEAGVSDPPPLPRVNVTDRPDRDFASAYASRASQARAAALFGPFMAEFCYQPPPGWTWKVPRRSEWEYALGHRARLALARWRR
jgi:hypothetical protein